MYKTFSCPFQFILQMNILQMFNKCGPISFILTPPPDYDLVQILHMLFPSLYTAGDPFLCPLLVCFHQDVDGNVWFEGKQQMSALPLCIFTK